MDYIIDKKKLFLDTLKVWLSLNNKEVKTGKENK